MRPQEKRWKKHGFWEKYRLKSSADVVNNLILTSCACLVYVEPEVHGQDAEFLRLLQSYLELFLAYELQNSVTLNKILVHFLRIHSFTGILFLGILKTSE